MALGNVLCALLVGCAANCGLRSCARLGPRDVRLAVPESEDSNGCQVSADAGKLVVTPDPSVEVTSKELRFGVTVENSVPETVGVRRDFSLAYPGATWLLLSIGGGVSGGDSRSLAGPEVYDMIGKVRGEKVCIPGRSSVRFANSIPLDRLRYFGSPDTPLEWNLSLSGVDHRGSAKVVLPRRETLVLAIEFADVAEVKRLLSHGADVRAKDEYGATPLAFAIGGGREHRGGLVSNNRQETREIVTLLLEHGAPLAGALPRAGPTDDEQLLALLLAKGADVNEANEEGNTALHEAFNVTPPRRDILRFLIEHGANLYAKNRAGRTPLDRAYDEDTRSYMLGIKPKGPASP